MQLGLGAFSFTRGNVPAGFREVAPPPGFPCSNCPKAFKTSAALTIHVGLKHPDRLLPPFALALEASVISSLFDEGCRCDKAKCRTVTDAEPMEEEQNADDDRPL